MKTAELKGAILDCWVAKALRDYPLTAAFNSAYFYVPYSMDWSQGGPIIEREHIELHQETYVRFGVIQYNPYATGVPGMLTKWYGETPLIAAMRCYVASKFGETVDDRQAHPL
jgi:hypothetical protein